MLFVEKILYTIIKRNIFMMDDLNLSKHLHPLLLFSEYYYQLSIIMTKVPLSRSIKRRNQPHNIIHNATYKIKIRHSLIKYYYDKNTVNFQLVMFRIIVWVSILCDNYLQCINTYRILRKKIMIPINLKIIPKLN